MIMIMINLDPMFLSEMIIRRSDFEMITIIQQK